MKASHFILTFLFFVTTNAACPSFSVSYLPTRTSLCPGDVITYTCTLSSNLATIVIWWTGSGFQCSNHGAPVNTISLPQTSFNGTTVVCKDGIFGTTIGSDTLNVQMTSPPSTPTITSLTSSSPEQLTVNWTSVPTATSYNVSINGSTPISLPANTNTYTFTGLTSNLVYIVSVVTINCAGNSSPAMAIAGRAGITTIPPSEVIGTTPMFATIYATTSVPSQSTFSAIGTAVGVSVSVTFVISFSMGVLVASVLCYISRSPKQSSPKPSSNVDPATVYDEVGTNKKISEEHTQMTANAAYGSYI